MLSAINSVANLLGHMGYGAIYVVLFIESMGIPMPSEITLLFSGFLVSKGQFSYPLTVIAGALGSTSGAIIAYYLARIGGRPLMLTKLRFIFKSQERLDYWEQYFKVKGDKVVLIGRIISGVRMIISYPAGLFKMPFRRFLIYTFIGSVLWPLIAVTAGYLLGPHLISGLKAIHQYELPVTIVVIVLIVIGWLWERKRRQRRESRRKSV